MRTIECHEDMKVGNGDLDGNVPSCVCEKRCVKILHTLYWEEWKY